MESIFEDELTALINTASRNDCVDDIFSSIFDFFDVQRTLLGNIHNVVHAAGLSQMEIINSLRESIRIVEDIIGNLADSAETDEARIKMAEITLELGRISKETALVYERINRDNNSFWKFIAGGLLVIAGIAIVCVAVSAGKKYECADDEIDCD